jgi:hypothetical protein
MRGDFSLYCNAAFVNISKMFAKTLESGHSIEDASFK